jgi:hypothetical protein
MPRWSAGRLARKQLVLTLFLLGTLAPDTTAAQDTAGGSRTFDTGKTVRGKFLQYWDRNGGLEQFGRPLTDELQERSAIDGKTYTVQYFQGSAFELHPESAPHDVLLSLLGVLVYREKYPRGAAGQVPNNVPGSIYFSSTGKRLGGAFLNYWQTHGGLTRHGLPISDEFYEVLEVDGRRHKVQYFERSVFTYFPNLSSSRQVLLPPLGKERLLARRSP